VLSPAEAVELLGRRLAALIEEAEQIRADVKAALDGGLEWVFVVQEEYRLAVLDAEGAVRLARRLPDVPSAFAAYEALRGPRVEKVAARAAKTNGAKGFGPVASAVMPPATKTFLTPDRMLGAEQRHHIDWELRVAG
jgi:hypothetical protein